MNKRIATLALLAVLGLAWGAAPAAAANSKEFRIIQNAVKKDPGAERARGDRGEARWLKLVLQDSRSGPAKVKITLPVALIEAVLACTDGRHFKVDDGECEIDLKAVWAALKKAGPLALVEIEDGGALIKVWLE
jgi:hypothetical protein